MKDNEALSLRDKFFGVQRHLALSTALQFLSLFHYQQGGSDLLLRSQCSLYRSSSLSKRKELRSEFLLSSP